MEINGVEIEDTFAEAFEMHMNRAIITAYNEDWARITALETTGFGTSIIGSPAEAGIEHVLSPKETPDGRPGVRVMIATAKKSALEEQLVARIGQCVLTSPTACVYDDTPSPLETYPVGKKLSMFGDGYQIKKGPIDGRILWLIPRMSGTFVVQNDFGRTKGVAGGNIIYFCESLHAGMSSGRAAVEAIEGIEGVYTPFPGGLVGSGSKPKSKHKGLVASTNERYCPTIRAAVPDTAVPEGCEFVMEIVLNGISEETVGEGMKTAIQTVCAHRGVLKVSAGNFGGSLGRFRIRLHSLLA